MAICISFYMQSSETSYTVTPLVEQSAIMITAIYQPPLTVIATLTCTEMRDQVDDEGLKGTLMCNICQLCCFLFWTHIRESKYQGELFVLLRYVRRHNARTLTCMTILFINCVIYVASRNYLLLDSNSF